MYEQGFDMVDYVKVTADIEDAVNGSREKIADFPLPSDGLVLIFDHIEYGRSLGSTAKFPRDPQAFSGRIR